MSEDTTRQFPIPPDNSFKKLIREAVDEALQPLIRRFDELTQRFEQLDEKVDRRLQDTRPIWEEVRSRLEQVELRLEKLGTKIDLLVQDVFEVRSNQENLKRRVTRLEEPPS
jgi:transposase